MIAIVNYGLGNVQAVANIYRSKNIAVTIASDPAELRKADRVILPGVGAFDRAMELLDQSGMRETVDDLALVQKRPVLGICVGMQMMADRSEEGSRPGLGWIPGEVKRFDVASLGQRTHLPHMGWNDVVPREGSSLFRQLETDARFYFLHSYYFAPTGADSMLATTCYGTTYASSVARENIFGVQFHPEKSHQWGIQLLLNFARL